MTIKDNESQTESEFHQMNFKMILIIAIVLGIVLNWLSLYISISLGFLSLGMGATLALMVSKAYLRRTMQDNEKNLSLVSVAFGATRAAEASVGLLFILWLALNAERLFNLAWDPPSWFLPEKSVIENREIFNTAWITPLLVHYFLMIVPGILGILIGYLMKDHFIKNEKEYPFPGIILTQEEIKTFARSATKERQGDFLKFAIAGFFIAGITALFLPYIDISQPTKGWIFGFMFGPIGLALFVAGFVIAGVKSRLPLMALLSSIFAYLFMAPIFANEAKNTSNFYDFYTALLSEAYFSFLLGFLLSAIILAPIVWSLIKGLFKKSNLVLESKKQNDEQNNENKNEFNTEFETETTSKESFLLAKKKKFLAIYSLFFLIVYSYVMWFDIFKKDFWIVLLLIFWIFVIGSLIKGYLTVSTAAKSSTAMDIPFIFNEIPVYAVGVRTLTPYLAYPRYEIMETLSVVNSFKLAQMNDVKSKNVTIAYLVGYFASVLTTPIFALLLFSSFGIGTPELPAPAFPINGAIIAAFASGSPLNFLIIEEISLGVIFGLIFGPEWGIGIAFGILFPPHMAVPIAFGGLTRLFTNRYFGKENVKKRGDNMATGLGVGASFILPILILFALLF